MSQTPITVVINPNGRYSAHIADYNISTQGKNRDELLINIKEAFQCYIESEKKLQHTMGFSPLFYLDMSDMLHAA